MVYITTIKILQVIIIHAIYNFILTWERDKGKKFKKFLQSDGITIWDSTMVSKVSLKKNRSHYTIGLQVKQIGKI